MSDENIVNPPDSGLPPEEKKAHPHSNHEFDLDKHRDDTANKAIAGIFRVWAEYADQLASTQAVNADKDEGQEIYGKVAEKMRDVMIDCNVAEGHVQFILTAFQSLPAILFTIMAREKREYEQEFLARSIGTRNPKEGVYDRQYATYGDLIHALIQLKDKQGDNGSDYHFITKNPVSLEDLIPQDSI